jgi:hypothetical protein
MVTGAPGAKVLGADYGAFTVLIVIVAACVGFGAVDGFRWRRAQKQHVPT